MNQSRKNPRDLRTETQQNDDFFAEVAAELDYLDSDTVKRFYNALVRVSVRHLRKEKFLRLPDFGDAYLVDMNAKEIYNPRTAERKIALGKHFQMRFKPANRLRQYFAKISNSLPD